MSRSSSPVSEPSDSIGMAVERRVGFRDRIGLRGSILLVVVGLIFVAGSAGFLQWSRGSMSDAQSRYATAVEVAKKAETDRLANVARLAAARVIADRLAAEAQAKAAADATAIAAGFTSGSEYVYWKPAPSSCGYLNCSTVLIAVARDCFRGVYVAASLMSGSTSIGLTNGITAGLPAGGSAILRMEFAGRPDSVTITDVHCMG